MILKELYIFYIIFIGTSVFRKTSQDLSLNYPSDNAVVILDDNPKTTVIRKISPDVNTLEGPIADETVTIAVDTKDLVDMMIDPVVFDELEKKLSWENYLPDQMESIIDDYLIPKDLSKNPLHPGGDLSNVVPDDFSEDISFIKIKNQELLNVLNGVNMSWKFLMKFSNNSFGDKTTLINTGRPFIVPGGRFREFYYWDSYWTLKGLLGLQMYNSAMNMILNFTEIIKTYGYIPNGSRTYYLGRSQPPFFTQMIYMLYQCNIKEYNADLLGYILDAALTEYEWFDKNRKVKVIKNNKCYHLNGYNDNLAVIPRIESYKADLSVFREALLNGADISTGKILFKNLRAAAESGWDFSSRWLADGLSLKTIHTVDFIPVDLNAILYRNEIIISHLLEIRDKNCKKCKIFKRRAEKRRVAIQKVLWNPEMGVWCDYNVKNQSFNSDRFYFSNITPMVFGIDPPENGYKDILLRYSDVLFGYPGGIPASSEKPILTNHQWDFPNSWAPFPSMLVDFLVQKNEYMLSLHVAQTFFNAVNIGFKKFGVFFEKYMCNDPGSTGNGGEYVPQTGFGWTNGTIIDFAIKFGDELANNFDHSKSYEIVKEYLAAK